MKIITGSRGSGITSQLVMQSATFNIPILTVDINGIRHINMLAKELNVDIPKPMSMTDSDFKGRTFENGIIIDNLDYFIQRTLREKGIDAKIDCVGISFGYNELIK